MNGKVSLFFIEKKKKEEGKNENKKKYFNLFSSLEDESASAKEKNERLFITFFYRA